MSFLLGELQVAFDRATRRIVRENTVGRIWCRDHSVWQTDPTEISDRLGWLDIPSRMESEIPILEEFATTVCSDGYTDVLLLGMGGASLAAEVFAKVFGTSDSFLRLSVLDSIDSHAVIERLEKLNLSTTLFLVSTKSGNTVETLSLFKHCYEILTRVLGNRTVGEHFVAITDPGSNLAKIAEQKDFRKIFFGDPTIGGRFSALSVFGLVPAALLGINLESLLRRAITMARRSSVPDSTAVQLGVALGVSVLSGRDKLTMLCDPDLDSFGNWVEQLIAESTGKATTGMVPVVGEPLALPEYYGRDRLFVRVQYNTKSYMDNYIDFLSRAGHPTVTLKLQDRYDLAGQFFLWEMATAVAATFLSINPFNQPDVESTKLYAQEIITMYETRGYIPSHEPILCIDTATFHGDLRLLRAFVDEAPEGAYLSLQAYVPPSLETDAALLAIRLAVQKRVCIATTCGYGPRFLHSTGQLHKGDSGQGRFIQIISSNAVDKIIQSQKDDFASITFETLKNAQALGDRHALLAAGRPVLTVCVTGDATKAILKLASML